MQAKSITLRCSNGLHLRVAGTIVKLVRDRDATVRVTCGGGRPADARSILDLLALGAATGSSLEISADGPDEAAVLDALSDAFEGGAGI